MGYLFSYLGTFFFKEGFNYFFIVPHNKGISTEAFWNAGVDWILDNFFDPLKVFNTWLIVDVLIPMKNAFLRMPVVATFILFMGAGYIIGGLRSDFEKLVLRKIWKKISLKLRSRRIFNLFIKPIKTEIGADFHYASSLADYTDKDGFIKFKNNITNVMVIDSSSSDILPTPNPTFYFLSRAIKLLRKI